MDLNISNPISAGIDLVKSVLDRVIPDKGAAQAAKAELDKLQLSGELQRLATEAGLLNAQIEVNKIEAANKSIFVAGWRPFIGWVCGASLAYNMMLMPLLTFVVHLCGSTVVPPATDTATLSSIVLSLLGLGAMRTVEKIKGVEPAVPRH